MNLENTKVYTTDQEVIRKYAELCGRSTCDFHVHELDVGVASWGDGKYFGAFSKGSVIDIKKEEKEITPDQINALYAEKFGKVETPEEAEAFDFMVQDNEQLQNYEMGDLNPVIDVDGKLYTADDVRELLNSPELPNVLEWKNGDVCDYKNEDDEWESNGRYVCFDSFAGHHVIVANNMGMYHAASDQIRKPKTPEQRDERERLEAAYELYCYCSYKSGLDYEDFVSGIHSTELAQWLSAVDKTGYRKQKDGE